MREKDRYLRKRSVTKIVYGVWCTVSRGIEKMSGTGILGYWEIRGELLFVYCFLLTWIFLVVLMILLILMIPLNPLFLLHEAKTTTVRSWMKLSSLAEGETVRNK